MAQYTSRFPKLAFYVNGEQKRFNNGVYSTDNKDEIAVLETIKDAHRVVEKQPKAEAPKPKATGTKTEAKPKATTTRKASVK